VIKYQSLDFSTLNTVTYDSLLYSFLFVVSGFFLVILRIMLVTQSIVVFVGNFGEGIPDLDNKVAAYWENDEVSECGTDYDTHNNISGM